MTARRPSEVRGGSPPAPLPDTGIGPVPTPGRLDRLAPGLGRLTAPNPGVMTGPGTNTYLVGDGQMAVVDPGPDDPGHLDAVVEAVDGLGGTVRWVLVTHTHQDHAPGAAGLAARTGAETVGFGPKAGFSPDRVVGEGWTLDAPTFRLTALHTPGHASDHLCWLLEEPRILLSGDHVMDGVTVVIAPPDGNMAAYLANLRRIRDLDPPLEAIAPGHGRLLGRPAEVVSAVLDHRLAREKLVAAALERLGQSTVDELVPVVYADVDPALHAIARASLWAHLDKLADDGRAVEVPGGPTPAYRPAATSASGA